MLVMYGYGLSHTGEVAMTLVLVEKEYEAHFHLNGTYEYRINDYKYRGRVKIENDQVLLSDPACGDFGDEPGFTPINGKAAESIKDFFARHTQH
jgi:hypothetical protein